MRKLLIALLLCLSGSAFAQVNYVLNPDFEEKSSCPQGPDDIRSTKFWTGVDSTGINSCIPEYCHTCATDFSSAVPYNGNFYQSPYSGKGMAQVLMFFDESIAPPFSYYRDYLQGRFYKKVTTGKSYCVSFYVNLTESSKYAIREISAYLDNGIIDTTKTCSLPQTMYLPQVSHTGGVLNDTANWVRIQGHFIASGKEQFITIGNFKDKANTTYSTLPHNSYNGGSRCTWYLIDDVSVIESDLKADAGPDTHVGQGDSVYIGRPKEVGLECTWSVLGSTAVIGTGAGMWVKPAATTSYVVTQKLCGAVKKDTVRVEVWGVGLAGSNGQAQQYSLIPNPGNGHIHLSQVAADALPVSVTVFESSGRQVYKGGAYFQDGKASLDLSYLAPGFYYLQLRDSRDSVYVLKFLRQ